LPLYCNDDDYNTGTLDENFSNAISGRPDYPFCRNLFAVAGRWNYRCIPDHFAGGVYRSAGGLAIETARVATFQRFQESLAQGEIPAYEMVEGPIILVGGALLLTPGFITDIIGFACLIPQLRRKIAQYVIEHYLVQAGAHFQQAKAAENNVLEGEFSKEE